MKYLERHDCFIDEDGNVYLECQCSGWHSKGKMFTAPMYLNKNGYWYVLVRKKAYYRVNKDRMLAHDKEKRNQKRAEGYRYRKCPDGKHRWVKVEVV